MHDRRWLDRQTDRQTDPTDIFNDSLSVVCIYFENSFTTNRLNSIRMCVGCKYDKLYIFRRRVWVGHYIWILLYNYVLWEGDQRTGISMNKYKRRISFIFKLFVCECVVCVWLLVCNMSEEDDLINSILNWHDADGNLGLGCEIDLNCIWVIWHTIF